MTKHQHRLDQLAKLHRADITEAEHDSNVISALRDLNARLHARIAQLEKNQAETVEFLLRGAR